MPVGVAPPQLRFPALDTYAAGILAGAVSITAPCAYVQSYGAVIIGAIGACVYYASSKLLIRCVRVRQRALSLPPLSARGAACLAKATFGRLQCGSGTR